MLFHTNIFTGIFSNTCTLLYRRSFFEFTGNAFWRGALVLSMRRTICVQYGWPTQTTNATTRYTDHAKRTGNDGEKEREWPLYDRRNRPTTHTDTEKRRFTKTWRAFGRARSRGWHAQIVGGRRKTTPIRRTRSNGHWLVDPITTEQRVKARFSTIAWVLIGDKYAIPVGESV